MNLQVRKEILVLILQSTLKFIIWAGKMAQWIKVLLHTSGDPSSSLESLMVEGEVTSASYLLTSMHNTRIL